ncbi:MAG: right-handed parallel beta-helix repeat-containing protein [Candidatus Bathyarchaeota archaeon]|nr:MAG: right-handed parallel beta-helix repeat-containing protein [Candidatus Bathyarchaeota archaeon]
MKRKAIVCMISMSFLIAMLAIAFNIQPLKASGTIYIRANGSVDPLTANITSSDNITYYFTENNYDSLIIEKANVVIDGAGYRLQGTGSGTGIDAQISGPWEINVTIKNMEIVSFASGIRLSNDANITIYGNEIRNCTDGIDYGESFSNTISGNIITNNTNGIGGSAFSDSIFSRNIIANNTVGIYLRWANDNVIHENNITNNDYGIWFSGSNVYNNTFYHNNFINNTNQVYIEQTNPNTWDNGYPSGGNYWDDFPDLYPLVEDIYSGSDQNESGSDGIWDGPYITDANNTDNYPLTTIISEFPAWTSMLPIFFALTIAIAVYKRRLAKKPIR